MSDQVIVILTDFGGQDPFVGIMKGVIARIHPDARTIDLGHEISPGDLRRAAVQLWQAAPYFPKGTIFLVVVDPGVGSTRRGLIAAAQEQFFIGPDNGVFSFIFGETCDAWELKKQDFQLASPSATFHGRDVFAPAAAYCSLGHLPPEFGPRIQNPIRLNDPTLRRPVASRLDGEILYADRFGNLLTSLGRFSFATEGGLSRFLPWLPSADISAAEMDLAGAVIQLPGRDPLMLVRTFAEIPPGECAGLVGSSGLIEIAANGSAAADLLRVSRGTPVSLSWKSTPHGGTYC